MARSPVSLSGRIAILAVSIIGLAAAYFVAGKFGLSLAFVNTSATAVWPPTGISLAALLLLGMRIWPGVFLGAFITNLTTTGDPVSSTGIAVGNTLEALAGAFLVTRFANGARAFERPQDVIKFAFFGALVSTAVSATIGSATLALSGLASWSDLGPIWSTWWLGDVGGALIFAPVLITWATLEMKELTWRPVERSALIVAVIATGVLLFGGIGPISPENDPLAFLCFPALVWAAYRFGPREAATAVLLLALIADWGTLHGFGPFARGDQNESLIYLQAFMGVAAVTSLALAAAVLDRQRAQKTIQMAEQRLRMVAEESARIREEFLSIATHELRTPVAALRGYIQLGQHSLDRGQHERLRGTLKVALRQTDRLATLIAQLLDASQMQTGRLKIERMPTDISSLVSSAVDAERLASEARPWVVQIEPDLRANADPVRFEQVVVNLIDNAVKFSPSGGTVTVRLRDEGGELRLEVGDQGIGIAPDRAARIFERFYRAHDDRGISGLGLGLYISKQIVELHGGRIEVNSELGRGTTFVVALPRLAAALTGPRPAASVRGKTGRVLVVDDDRDVRALVVEVLRDAGLAVITAADGNEALAQAAQFSPDLIILDRLMPGMDGTEFARLYRATGQPAPIIAFCAARDAAAWAKSIAAVGFIGKPFDVKDLERMVLEHLPATA
jgi:signal transduction histidine kinase/CheY-like chemotaxis protein